MGDIKRKRSLHSRPRKPFDRVRIDEENVVVNTYGLKNKKEIWKAQSVATKFRQQAKKLISKGDEDKRKFLDRLAHKGIVVENISDVLALTEKDVLSRRLQTVLVKKKLASTPKQARQLIVHKYVIVAGNIVNAPSFWVTRDLENEISVRPKKEKKVAEDAPVKSEQKNENEGDEENNVEAEE